MKNLFIVVSDHKYYPSVIYCDTIEEAESVYNSEMENLKSKDGKYNSKIIIAKIMQQTEIKSEY
jgi:hypothetical protein